MVYWDKLIPWRSTPLSSNILKPMWMIMLSQVCSRTISSLISSLPKSVYGYFAIHASLIIVLIIIVVIITVILPTNTTPMIVLISLFLLWWLWNYYLYHLFLCIQYDDWFQLVSLVRGMCTVSSAVFFSLYDVSVKKFRFYRETSIVIAYVMIIAIMITLTFLFSLLVIICWIHLDWLSADNMTSVDGFLYWRSFIIFSWSVNIGLVALYSFAILCLGSFFTSPD